MIKGIKVIIATMEERGKNKCGDEVTKIRRNRSCDWQSDRCYDDWNDKG